MSGQSSSSLIQDKAVTANMDITKEPFTQGISPVDPLSEEQRTDKDSSHTGSRYSLEPSKLQEEDILLHHYTKENDINNVSRLIMVEEVPVDIPDSHGRTAVMLAAGFDNVEVLQELIYLGANLEAEDKEGLTALLWAAKQGKIDTLQKLTSSSADILHTDKQGRNILHIAALNNDVDLIDHVFAFLENSLVANDGEEDKEVSNPFKMFFGGDKKLSAQDLFKDETLVMTKKKNLETLFLQKELRHGQSAVHLAVKEGHVESVEKLMQYKTDIMDNRDKNGHDPFALAVWQGNVKMVNTLSGFPRKTDGIDIRGRSTLHLAVESGVPEIVDLSLNKSAADTVTISHEGDTPLHLAASLGHTDIMAALMQKMDDVNVRNEDGETALHLAASANHTMAVTTLIHSNHGCDIDARNLREETALHCAVIKGYIKVVELLLVAGANSRATDDYGKTALDLACRNGLITLIDLVIKAERFEDLQKEGSISPYNKFTIKERVDVDRKCLKEALQKMTADHFTVNEWKVLADEWFFSDDHMMAIENNYKGPNSWIEDGYRVCLIWLHGLNREDNPMMILQDTLTLMGKTKLAKVITKTWLKQAKRRDSDSDSVEVLCIEIESGRIEKRGRWWDENEDDQKFLTCVLEAECQVDIIDEIVSLGYVDKQDSEGRSALYLAVESGMVEIVDMLLKSNANLVTKTFQGNTPLHLAASLRHTDIMVALMEKMADVNVRNEDGETALHLAASANDTMAVVTIIHSNHGCDIDARNLREETALHCAVDKGHIAVVELLLVNGASVEAKEDTGKTIIEIACGNNFATIVDLLIKFERFHELQTSGNIESDLDFRIGYRVDVDAILFNRMLLELTFKYLTKNEWKLLAKEWCFSDQHLNAIEKYVEGPKCWKEHGYRMCLIWLHGLNEEDDPMKCLNEVLIKLGKEKIIQKL